jgi:hypothetical protein
VSVCYHSEEGGKVIYGGEQTAPIASNATILVCGREFLRDAERLGAH